MRAPRYVDFLIACLLAALAAVGVARADVEARIEELVKREAYGEALKLAEETVEFTRRAPGETSVEHLRSILTRANILVLVSRAPEAGKVFDDLHRRLRALPEPDPGLLSTTLSNLAVQRRWVGQFDEAAHLAREAVVIAESLDTAAERHRLILTSALMNLGVMLRYQGQPAAALAVFLRAQQLADGLTEHPAKRAEVLQNIASAREDLGDWKQSRIELVKAFEIATRVLPADHSHFAVLRNRIGISLYFQRQFQEARAQFRDAYARQARARQMAPVTRAAILSDHAKNELELGRFAEAGQLLKQALAIRQSVLSERHPDIARTLSDIAEVAFRSGQIRQALDGARTASFATIETGKTDLRSLLTFHRHVRVLWANYEKARGNERTAFALEAFEVAQHASRTNTSQTITRMAVRLAEKDQRVADYLRQRDDSEAEIPALEAQLTAALALPADQRSEMYERARTRLRHVEGQLAQAQRSIDNLAPGLGGAAGVVPLDADEVGRQLASDQVLVMVLVSYQETFVWAISRNTVVWVRVPIAYNDMRLYVNELRRGLAIDFNPDWTPEAGSPTYNLLMAHDLHVKLFGDLSAAMAGKAHILFVPTGPLISLPPHVLITKAPKAAARGAHPASIYRDAAWLARSHAVSVLPSVQSLKALAVATQDRSSEHSMFGFGDPVFNAAKSRGDGDPCATVTRGTRSSSNVSEFWRGSSVLTQRLSQLCPLPEGRDELENIAKAIGSSRTVLKLGSDARESVFKSEDLTRHRVVYFATHALVAGELGAGEPGIVLTVPDKPTAEDDGFLGASEVALTKLDADWVVLSACNTASGTSSEAEGLSGLARAFFHAGARALLVTHWNVGSGEAMYLASRTFEALHKDPRLGKAKALRLAMLSLIDSHSHTPWHAHPGNWAPFVVVESGVEQPR